MKQIKKWRTHGKDITQFPTTITRDRWPLTQEMEHWATSPEVLQEMVSDSLVQRAKKIRDRYQLKSFSSFSVRTLYRKYKIKYISKNCKKQLRLQKKYWPTIIPNDYSHIHDWSFDSRSCNRF